MKATILSQNFLVKAFVKILILYS